MVSALAAGLMGELSQLPGGGVGVAKLSFAIPYYRNLRYLKQAVESARVQSVPDVEIIVVDDGGPEGEATRLWLEALADHRITYLRYEKNVGIGGNWNRCLAVARTPLVTLLHADDVVAPTYAAVMLAAADRWPAAAAFYCQARIIGPSSNAVFSFPDWYKRRIRRPPLAGGAEVLVGEPALSALLRGWFLFCPSLCYRRSQLAGRSFSTAWKMVLDVEFTAAILMNGETVIGLPEHAYFYRRHGGNQTSVLTNTLTRFEEEEAIYDQLAHRAHGLGWSVAAQVASAKSIVKLNLAYCLVRDLCCGEVRRACQKVKLLFRLVTSRPSHLPRA